ncbi:MAG: AraC family transcriptional regulator [bacterium]
MKSATLQDYKQRMLRVLVYIQQNLDRELSLQELAEVAHFSPYHFHRIFRGMVGETLQGHIRRIRLERAAARLMQTDRSIIRIAFEAGYESHEAFTRAFQTMTGQAPSAFRVQRQALNHGPSPTGVHYPLHESPDDFDPLENGGSTMDVTIKIIDPQRVAFMRHVGPYNQVGGTWEKLCMQLGAQGLLGPGATFFGLCYDDPEVTPAEKIRYDACITVDEKFQPEGDIGVQTIPGGDYAVTTHHGPYEKLNETYAQLCGQWAPRSGRTVAAAPCFEHYLNDPQSTEPEELLTDIHMPLEPR